MSSTLGIFAADDSLASYLVLTTLLPIKSTDKYDRFFRIIRNDFVDNVNIEARCHFSGNLFFSKQNKNELKNAVAFATIQKYSQVNRASDGNYIKNYKFIIKS